MFLLAKYNTQTTFTFPMPKAGSRDLAATGDWTPATGDTKISKDAGNVANTTNNPAAVGGTGSVMWSLVLTAAELSAAVIDVQFVDSATKAVDDQSLKIYTYGNASAKIPFDLSVLTQSVNVVGIIATALTEGASGRAAGAFSTFLNVASPVLTTASINQTGDGYARLGAPSGASVSADILTGLNRLGAWTGSGLNTILGAFRAMMNKLAALTPTDITSGGGTFDNTTDSQEAFKDGTATLAEMGTAAAQAIKLKKNVALSNFRFQLFLKGTRTEATGKTVTCTRLLDADVAFSGMANTASEVGATGTYRINITTADINCDCGTWKFTANDGTTDPVYIDFVTQS
jgi:hypothetical protein